MEDIEDMFKNDDGQEDQKRVAIKKKVMRKTQAAAVVKEEDEGKPEDYYQEDGVVIKATKKIGDTDDQDQEVVSSSLPGRQKIFVKTYGCSHNISDSEYMAGLLTEYGFTLVDKMEDADACLLNSCTVKNPSQEKFIK